LKHNLIFKIFLTGLFSILIISCSDSSTGTRLSSGTDPDSSGDGTISFTPSSGPIGTLVTVSSTDTDLTDLQQVKIGTGTSAIVFNKTSASASVSIMPDATTGTITAVMSSKNIVGGSFTVTANGIPASQQGSKLIGTGNVGTSRQGISLSLSDDGNTLLAGGYGDDSNAGAAWVFTRSGTTWTQQGSKLVGTGATTSARQGGAVVLSADGNTALVGGYGDDSSVGAVWVFTRDGSTWSQQGSKLVGTGGVGGSLQGYSLALSADGNTALVGGYGDDSNAGAAWVFTRTGTTWSQQGSKLVGTGAVGSARQGTSVALSADGNTAMIGGSFDDSSAGAAWVFTRSGTTWTQQGSKLVGSGATGAATQGSAVALSADGDTALVGGSGDDTSVGAAWVFTRSGTTWTQQGSKITSTDSTGASRQGTALALSADGNTALIGGYSDNTNVGAAWIFTRTSTTWTQQGTKLVGTGATGSARQGFSVSLSADASVAAIGGFGDNTNVGAAWVFAP
jgi:hypothetical protein